MAKVKTIYITAKCSDACHIQFHDEDGERLGQRNDYVPDWMPEDHYGDYIELEINVATGKIVNWRKPTQKELKDSITDK